METFVRAGRERLAANCSLSGTELLFVATFQHEFAVNPAVTMTNALDVICFLLSFGPRQEVSFVPSCLYYLVLDWQFIYLKQGGEFQSNPFVTPTT